MKSAHFIKVMDGWTGYAKLYRLTEPLAGFEYVVVSAVTVPYTGAETYIFGTDEHGKVQDWGELEGSYRGGLSHVEALQGAGYAVIEAL